MKEPKWFDFFLDGELMRGFVQRVSVSYGVHDQGKAIELTLVAWPMKVEDGQPHLVMSLDVDEEKVSATLLEGGDESKSDQEEKACREDVPGVRGEVLGGPGEGGKG